MASLLAGLACDLCLAYTLHALLTCSRWSEGSLDIWTVCGGFNILRWDMKPWLNIILCTLSPLLLHGKVEEPLFVFHLHSFQEESIRTTLIPKIINHFCQFFFLPEHFWTESLALSLFRSLVFAVTFFSSFAVFSLIPSTLSSSAFSCSFPSTYRRRRVRG